MSSGAASNTPNDDSAPPATDRRAEEEGRLQGLTKAKGIIMIVFGMMALSFPVVASTSVTVLVAIAFLVGGIMGLIDNLSRAQRLGRWHCFRRLVVVTLFLVTGLWMVIQFKPGILPAALQVKAVATAIAIVFLVEGVVMAIVSLTNRAPGGGAGDWPMASSPWFSVS